MLNEKFKDSINFYNVFINIILWYNVENILNTLLILHLAEQNTERFNGILR